MANRNLLRCSIPVTLVLGLVVPGLARAGERWLHVLVEESGGETVRVNLPLASVQSFLGALGEEGLDTDFDLDLDLPGADIDSARLRNLLVALRDAPDAVFVTVNGEDESMRVAKEGDMLLVDVDERGDRDGEKVRVRLPIAVVAALVEGDADALDFAAALRELEDGGDLVRIESADEHVRIWVDSRQDGI